MMSKWNNYFFPVTPSDEDFYTDYKYEEIHLPDYDLPMIRQKTNLEVFESDEQEKRQDKEKNKNQCPDSWEKLEPKPKDDPDVNDVLILGKGKAPGKSLKVKIYRGKNIKLFERNCHNVLVLP